MQRDNGNFPSENRMLEATYNVLDVMKMKRYFVSKIVQNFREKTLRKISRLKAENLQKGKVEKFSSGLKFGLSEKYKNFEKIFLMVLTFT